MHRLKHSSGSPQVENISVLIPKLDGLQILGHTVDTGTIYDDTNSKMVIWKVGVLPGKTIRLKAKVRTTEKYSGVPNPNLNIMLRLTANDANISGVKIKGVKVGSVLPVLYPLYELLLNQQRLEC